MTQPDWDDERLDAAFQARFDRPAPTNLAKEVHIRIAGTSPARFGGLRVARAWTYAAAAVVVVLVAGTALVGLGELGRSGGSPLPSDLSSAGTGPSATPTEQALPGSVFDGALPVINVPDAIAIRDAGVDDRELAVQGWFRPAALVSCPFTPTVSPLQLQCPDEMIWLTRDFEPGSSGQPFDQPVGPSLRPDLDGLDVPLSATATAPIDVVFVGHFDDRRSKLCPAIEIETCRDRFVVDSVAIVHGIPQPASVSHLGREEVSSVADIEAIIATEAPDSTILSMTVVVPDGIAAFEPSLAPMVQGLVDHHPNLWIVRVLESERAVTYIIIDGSDAIYEMNADGEAILVGGEPPLSQATPSPAVWPPSGAPVVVLTSEVGAGEPPVRVAVVDESGRLSSASETGDVDPATISFDGRFGAYAEPGHSGRVHLTWIGGICDSQITVTVAEDIKTITFDMGAPVDCDSIGIGRQLVLDFTGLVDVPAIRLGDGIATPPAGPSYDLDCGPLGPDTCQQRAERLVAANAPKIVVSIVFDSLCGSSTVTLSDGTVRKAIIDCIPGASPS